MPPWRHFRATSHAAFETVFKAMVSVLGRSQLDKKGPSHARAQAIAALCVGESHPRLVPMNTQSGILRDPQARFSTGDAKPVRDLMRDLETVNRGEP